MKATIITLSGVDGAGKTTILKDIKRVLEEKYNKNVIELRQRPQILPILSSFKYGRAQAEKIAAENIPRKGGNESTVSSYVRYFYYLTDYLLGQLLIYVKYCSSKNNIILYDRYYFDYIVDPKRANMSINPKIALFFYNLVITPAINIFLYASPEIILSRKKELERNDIEILTDGYRTLFNALNAKNNAKYISINNYDKSNTIQLILKLLDDVI